MDGYDYAFVHRVAEIGSDKEGVYFVTKGDNYWKEDSYKVRFSHIEGIVVGILYWYIFDKVKRFEELDALAKSRFAVAAEFAFDVKSKGDIPRKELPPCRVVSFLERCSQIGSNIDFAKARRFA